MSIAVLLLVAGCRGSDGPTEPNLDNVRGLPRFDVMDLDCQMSDEHCRIMQAGINSMKDHANPLCRALAGSAQDRYDAPAGQAGYRNDAQYPAKDMGVNAIDYGSYVVPRDAYTNVYPSFWTNPYIGQERATGALILHEEVHHNGGTEDSAQRVQDECLNPSA